MNRLCRAFAVFLLALALALPAAALPAPERAPSWTGLLATLWDRVAPAFGLAGKSRSSMDPDGATTDSRASADPNGATTDSRAGADPNG